MTGSRNRINRINLFLSYFFLSSALLYLTYSPAVHIPFFHHDIYALCAGALKGSNVFHFSDFFANYAWLLDIRARPLGAIIGGFNVKYGNTLEGMSYVRAGGIVFIGLFAGAFAYWLRHLNFSYFSALLISIMIFCLPGIQTTVLMSAWFLAFSPFAAFIAQALIAKGANEWQGSTFAITSNIKGFSRIVLGLVCLSISFLTYPGVSGFFLIPSFVTVLFNTEQSWNKIRRAAIRDLFIFIAWCVLYYALGKLIQHLVDTTDLSLAYTFAMSFDFYERIVPLLQIFPSLWDIDYDFDAQAIVVYTVIVVAMGIRIFANIKATTLSMGIQSTVIIALFLLLACSAYLLQPNFYPFTRILFILQVMSVFILIWALKAISNDFIPSENKYFLEVLVLLTLIAVGLANYIVAKSALNDNMELNYIATNLSHHLSEKKPLKRIHIVGGYDSKVNFNGLKTRDDIFNINSTLYRQDTIYLLYTALLQIAQPTIHTLYDCALDEFVLKRKTEADCIDQAPKNSIVVTYSRQGQKVMPSPNMLVIDMTSDKLYTKNNPMHSKYLEA